MSRAIRTEPGANLVPGPGQAGIDAGRSLLAFQRYQLRASHIANIFPRIARYRPTAAELMPIVRHLSLRRAEDFTDLTHLQAEAGGQSGLSPGTVRAMRDLFLELPNRYLQRLYHAHFTAAPPEPGAPHADKIASLQRVEEIAQGVVADFDWDWLTDWLRLDLIGETAETCLLQLSNLAFQVRRVNFRFTHHCNIACRHCYNASGPYAKAQRLELDAMLAVIAQMPDAGIPALNLSGGEPFLYPDELMTLIGAGRAARLKEISVYTNGFWAATPERADQMLARLVAAGFMRQPRDHLKVSTGVYHQEFIEFDRIGTLGQSYYRAFGRRLRVDYELAPGRLSQSEGIGRSLTAAGLDRYVKVSFREAQPLGRGRHLTGASFRSIDAPCPLINEIVFDPDGAARPCGGLNNENHGIRIGTLKSQRLRDLIKRMQNDPILQFLARRPMSSIFDHVAAERNEAGYPGPCSLCQQALGGLTDKEALQARLFDQQEFYPFWFVQPPSGGTH